MKPLQTGAQGKGFSMFSSTTALRFFGEQVHERMNATVKQFASLLQQSNRRSAIASAAITDNRPAIAFQVQELYNAHVHKLYKASPNDLWRASLLLALHSLDNALQEEAKRTANYLSTTEEEARSAAASALRFFWGR